MKRIVLFVLTNLAIVVMLSLTLRLLGVEPYLTQAGLNLGALLITAAVIGFGGSFFSLAISKWMAKKSVGARVIDTPSTAEEQWVVATVRRQAQAAGIGMPEVAIYDSPEVNAFATGMNRNNALVAVSTGLLRSMTREEAEAVLAHEVSHVANGDMVTLALIQGVVNTFVFFLARIIGYLVDRVLLAPQQSEEEEQQQASGPGMAYFIVVLVAEIVLGILASIIVMWFSRQREFRADAGAARLANRQAMIAALQRLQAVQSGELPQGMAALGINNGKGGIMRLFMTHPPLEERIEALRRQQ